MGEGKRCSYDEDGIKQELLQMLKEEEFITLRQLKRRLDDRQDLSVSKMTLWKIMRKRGFTFRKNNNMYGKKTICEKRH